MWSLYQTAKATSERPSNLVEIIDAWAAYQFDSAVTFLGRAIENYSQELIEVGPPKEKRLVPKYSMEQLLDPDFLLPRPKTDLEKQRDALAVLKAMAGRKGSGVKVLEAA